MGTLTLLSQPSRRYREFRPPLSRGGEEGRRRAGSQASWASSVAAVKEGPSGPFSETVSPGRESYAASEGEWTVVQLSP